MKKILLFFALIVSGFSTVITAADTFDPATNTLTLDSVTVGGIKYPTVVVRLNQFTVLGVGNSAPVEDGISENCGEENFTVDKFGAIQEGMSIEQVTQIIGCTGEYIFRRDFSHALWSGGDYLFSVDVIQPTPTKFIVGRRYDDTIRYKSNLTLGGFFAPTDITSISNSAFDPATNVLTMGSVWVTGGLKYENAAVHLDQFTLLGVAGRTVALPPPVLSDLCSSENITIDKYNAIQIGMTLDQVNQIIGCTTKSATSEGSFLRYSWGSYYPKPAKEIQVYIDQSNLAVTGSMGDLFRAFVSF